MTEYGELAWMRNRRVHLSPLSGKARIYLALRSWKLELCFPALRLRFNVGEISQRVVPVGFCGADEAM